MSMKIGIIAPSPVPFTIGGAEKLFWGLQDAINQKTSHSAELIKLPSRESNIFEILESYEQFSKLELSHFDLVVSTKYPAWMVKHPNHVCYLQHRLRGLYDTYHFSHQPLEINGPTPVLNRLTDFMQSHAEQRASLNEFFALAGRCLNEIGRDASEWAFPGPLSRKIVHYLDGVGLAKHEIKHFAAISNTVKARADYFPAFVDINVVPHPSNLPYFKTGNYDYLFTVSRLDGPKRIAMLIEAMRLVRAQIPLYIAGTGPDEERLKALAGNDKRIVFLGFVHDSDLIEWYSNALAVIYVPYDEDYGLVTIEAMMSEKLVITTNDSGGPNEFVINGKNGFCSAPNAQALAKVIDEVCNSPEQAKAMGKAAKKAVSPIAWENVIDTLISNRLIKTPSWQGVGQQRKKITVAVPFPVYPPRGGGQSRVFHLYRHLAKYIDIDLVTIANEDKTPFNAEIAPHLREIRLIKTPAHVQAESELSRSVGWIPVSDIALTQFHDLTPAIKATLQNSLKNSAAVIASHPYLLPAFESWAQCPIWYEAHNVETILKASVFSNSVNGAQLIGWVRDVEKACCEKSLLIFSCSDEDSVNLSRLFNIDARKTLVVPNGVDLESVKFTDWQDRQNLKQRLYGNNVHVALFIGSWHSPNIQAVDIIIRWAKQLPNILFVIVGSVGLYYANQSLPSNVKLMGVVEDEVKDVILSSADVALNPMLMGSGTNLKMLDYFAAGIPVISTHFGARGLQLPAQDYVALVDVEQMVPTLLNQLKQPHTDLARQTKQVRKWVEQKFSWTVIADRFMQTLRDTVSL